MTEDELALIAAAAEKVTRERDQLRAENERLKDANDEWYTRWEQGVREIERLRAALQEVANISYISLLPDRVVEIVTNALKEP